MTAVVALKRPESRHDIPVPEPDLTPDQLIARATAMIPMLRDQQEEADTLGHYTQDIHEEFLRTGLYRTLQPRAFGGDQFSVGTFLEIVRQLSIGHSGSAWCFCLAASHSLVLSSHWPEDVQREFYAPAGDFRAPHRGPPSGAFVRVDGGFRVNGSWTYSSGCWYATHFAAGAIIPDAEGKPTAVNFFVPRDQITILDDWGGDGTLGMAASSSNTVVLKDVFVPDRYIGPGDVLFAQHVDYSKGTYGTDLFGDPQYLGVFGGAFHMCFAAMMTGTARAALEEFEAALRTRKAYGDPRLVMADDVEMQAILGQVVSATEAAEAIFKVGIETLTEPFVAWRKTHRPVTQDDTMKVWGLARQSCMLAVSAVEKMFHHGGVLNAKKGQRIQRYFRDVQMYRVHPSSQPWVDSARGQTFLGRPVEKFEPRTGA